MTLGDLTKFGKEFVSKNYHADKKDEKSISSTIYLQLNKVFFCYSSDKGFRIIGDVNIWRGKSEIIFKKNPLIKAFSYSIFYINSSSA